VLADAAFLAAAASRVSIRAHDLGLFAALVLCSTATVELTRRAGENSGFVKDVHAIWELPVAMLLPLTDSAGRRGRYRQDREDGGGAGVALRRVPRT
jgi:hypothetical protein